MSFQGQTLFWTYLRNGWSDWCETKRRFIGWYWVNYVTLTFDLTRDLDLVVSRSKFEIALFEEWGADWHGTKGMWVVNSWPWLWPMGNHGGVGGCTVWGDFRRRRAVDISSFHQNLGFALVPHLNQIALFKFCKRKIIYTDLQYE